MYQVQIYVKSVGRWYSWSGGHVTKDRKEAERQAGCARQFCWTTRIVKISQKG